LISRRAALLDAGTNVAVALGAVTVVALLRYAAHPLLQDRAIHVPFVLAVAVAAWFGGFGPGLIATIAGAAFAVWFVAPYGSFGVASAPEELALGIYVIAGVTVSTLASGLRAGRHRAEVARVIAENARRAEEKARRAAEAHAARASRLEAVAIAVGRELRPREAAEAVLREGLAALGAGSGVVGILDEAGEVITVVSGIGYPETTLERYRHFPLAAPFPLSEAVRAREPIVLHSADEIRTRYPELGATIEEAGTALVLPLIYEDRAIGGLYFRFREHREFDRDGLGYLMALGRQCAAALQRAQLYETEYAARRSAQQSAERLVFLAHASEVLGSSLDYETTVAAVARLAVPTIADWCAVHVLEPDGSIRIIALEHVDPAKVQLARRFYAGSPPTLDSPRGAGAVIRTGQTELVEWISDEVLESSIAADPDRFDVIRAIAPRSILSVPLIVRDRTLGALTLAAAESQRRFDDRDRALAEDLAHRAATAIDNARLFREREETSRDLRDLVRQQEALAMLGQQALIDEDLDRLFTRTLSLMTSVLDAELATLLQYDATTRTLRVASAAGWSDGIVGTKIPAATGDPGEALLATEPVVLDDASGDAVARAVPLLVDGGVVAHASVAITGTGTEPWGVLAVHSRTARRFDADDVTFIRAVVNILAGAIGRAAQLETERRTQDVGRAFIGVVSHELRTPITSIYAGAKLLNRRGSDDAERVDIAGDIEAEADRLYRLTEDLLVLTRLERHDLELGREPILVNHIISRVVASEERRWPLVSFSLNVQNGLPTVMGEESYVEQVVRNLVGNAAKYSPTNGHVEVVAEQLDGGVAVRVLDRGPGIGGSDPAQLFALFYRAPGTASQASGAGIGLFVCDQLVRAMGGHLWARPRDGGGSEFGFSLARYTEDSDLPSSAPTERRAFSRSRDGASSDRAGITGPRQAATATKRAEREPATRSTPDSSIETTPA
jgi:signal transduction histidine kinase